MIHNMSFHTYCFCRNLMTLAFHAGWFFFLGICALRRSGGVVSGTVSDERLGQQYDTGHGQVKPPYHAETKPAQKRVDKYYQRQKQVHDTAGQHQSGSGNRSFSQGAEGLYLLYPAQQGEETDSECQCAQQFYRAVRITEGSPQHQP